MFYWQFVVKRAAQILKLILIMEQCQREHTEMSLTHFLKAGQIQHLEDNLQFG